MRKITALAIFISGIAAAQTTYRKPPKAVQQVLDAPATPNMVVSPARTHALLIEPLRYPPITELSRPMAAGRIPHRSAE